MFRCNITLRTSAEIYVFSLRIFSILISESNGHLIGVMATFTVVQAVNSGLGIFFSLLLLLFLVIGVSRRIGAYRYLQMIFVSFNIYLTVFCWISEEGAFISDYKFCFFLFNNWFSSLHLVCLYSTSFAFILVVIAVHFLYRYWELHNPSYLNFFSKSRFLFTLVSMTAPVCAIWYASCHFLFDATNEQRKELVLDLNITFDVDAMKIPMIVGEYYRDGHCNARSLAGLGVFIGILFSGSTFMIFCSIRIMQYLSRAKIISARARKFHRSMLFILILQTIIPISLLHLPVIAALIAPLFRMNLNFLSDITVISSTFYAPLDALVVLTLMPEYRRAIAAIFHRKLSA